MKVLQDAIPALSWERAAGSRWSDPPSAAELARSTTRTLQGELGVNGHNCFYKKKKKPQAWLTTAHIWQGSDRQLASVGKEEQAAVINAVMGPSYFSQWSPALNASQGSHYLLKFKCHRTAQLGCSPCQHSRVRKNFRRAITCHCLLFLKPLWAQLQVFEE